MRLLVCGGAGFIGSNFVLYVLARHPDWSVVNFDKLTYAGNLDNLSAVEHDPRYSFVRGDIADQEAVDQVVEVHKPDAIVNLAAETHVDRSIHGSLREFVRTDVLGPQVLCEATKTHRIPLFLHVSTDEVYGALTLAEARRFTEETAFAPNMPYAACKAGGDLICRSYFHTFRTPVMVTHCSNNYGPYQFPEKFIPHTIFRALADAPVPIYGDGRYVRDWIYVEDHVRAIELLLAKGAPGEVYNIGADNERHNIEVARMILAMLGKPETLITHVEDRPGHDRRYAIDPAKLMRLGWTPHYRREQFEEGLKATVAWYRDNREWRERLFARNVHLNQHIALPARDGQRALRARKGETPHSSLDRWRR